MAGATKARSDTPISSGSTVSEKDTLLRQAIELISHIHVQNEYTRTWIHQAKAALGE